MFLRMLGYALLTGCLMFGNLGMAHASINTIGNDSSSHGPKHPKPKAVPEFSPAGVTVLVLSGGTLLWCERRRRNKQKQIA